MTFFFSSLFILLVFWRPQEWLVLQLYGWPVLDVIVVLAMFGLMIEHSEGKIQFPRRTPQLWLLPGLWFASVFSHVPHTYYAGMMMTIPDVFKICFFTWLLFVVLDRPERLRIVAILFVVMACVMAWHSLLQVHRGYGFAHRAPFWSIRPGQGRFLRTYFFGVFEDPNDMAQMFATAIPLSFVMTRRRSFWSFLLGCAITCLLLQGFFTTHSRGGYVALIAVAGMMIVMWLPSRWTPTLVVLYLMGALVLCLFAGPYLDMSSYERVIFWGTANQYFKANPFFGIGHGMFWIVASSRAAHNAFVSCYTTIGIFGYWFWYGLLFLAFVGAWRVRGALRLPQTQEQAWLRRFSGYGMAALAGFLASAYFLSRAFVYPFFFLVAMLGVLPAVTENHLPPWHPPLMNPRKDLIKWNSLTALTSILFIYVSILLLNAAYGG